MKTNRPGGLTLTRSALAAGNFEPGDLILDAGCGFGATVSMINRSGGPKAVGLDGDVSRLASAPKSGRDLTRGHTVAARLPQLPFRPGSFQGIFCECVLSLIPDKAACLRAFCSALAPGGTLVLADLVLPDGESNPAIGSGRPDTAAGGVTQQPTCVDGALTMAALTQEVRRAGFHITSVADHTRLLREMACQMVFEHGSLDRFWQELTGTDCPAGLAGRCRAGTLTPGYALLLAEKRNG